MGWLKYWDRRTRDQDLAEEIDSYLAHEMGGVPLGLKIAEDILAFGRGKASKKSTNGLRP